MNQDRHETKDIRQWGPVMMGLLFALLILGAAYRFGLTARALANLPTLVVLALAAILDIQRRTIPDWLTLPGLVWVLATSMLPGLSGPSDALLGALVCGGALLILAVVSRGSIGGGDVKLTALLGALVGWRWGLAVLFFAQVAAAVVAGCLLLAGRKGRKDVLPFGPFIAAVALLASLLRPF